MGYQDQGAGRQMFDVSSLGIQCASCGTKINELPFEPKSDRPVYCRDCNRSRNADKPQRNNFRQNQNFGGPRQTFDVSSLGLKCANCQTGITELPFEPKTDQPVYCRECNRERRQNFRR